MTGIHKKTIGIIGGIGPYAGVDLARKIFDQTPARRDQDHLPVILFSLPHSIPDRTEFILGHATLNPALPIAEIICALHRNGASVIGMPCNTAHASPIFEEIVRRIPKEVQLIHMIDAVAEHIRAHYPAVNQVGILSTTGTHLSRVYPDCLSRYGLNGLQVTVAIQEGRIHPAIYHPEYGIKARANPVSEKAMTDLQVGIEYLAENGAEVIVLGCTEIPLALTGNEVGRIPLIDATKILARALILAASP